MKIVEKYLYQKINKSIFQVLIVLSLTLIGFYLIHTMKFIIKYNASFFTVLTLLTLNIPEIFLFNIMISFFVGTMIAFDNLMKTNELVACKSIGLNSKEIGTAIIKVAVFGSIALVVMNTINIKSERYLRFQQERIITASAINALKPNQINNVGNLEIFFKEIKDKKTLKDVFIVQQQTEKKQNKNSNGNDVTTCDFISFSSNIKGINIKGHECKYLPDRDNKEYFYKSESIEYPIKSLKVKQPPKLEPIFYKLIHNEKFTKQEARIFINRISFLYLLLMAFALCLSLPEKTNARCKIKNVNLIPSFYFIYVIFLRAYLHEEMLYKQNIVGMGLTTLFAIFILFLIKPLLKVSNK